MRSDLAISNPVASGLTTRAVTTSEGLLSLRRAWTVLFEQSRCTNPFARWEWTYHWWQTFRRTGGFVNDHLRILVHEDGEGLVCGITPLVTTSFGHDRLRVTKLRNAGSVPGANITEMAPYLCAANAEVQVANALSHALYHHSLSCDWIELSGVPLDIGFGQAFAETPVGLRASWQAPTPYFPLVLPDHWETLRGHLTKNSREYLRQVDKRLERLDSGGHHVEFHMEDRPERMHDALEEFFRLHRARASAVRDETDPRYHPNQFRADATHHFLRAVASDLAEQGQFRVAMLLVDHEVVASRIVLPAGDHHFFYYSGFDPDWSSHKVMAMLTAHCVRAAIQAPDVSVVNLSTHADRSKLLWAPEHGHALGNLRLPSPTVRGSCIDRLAQRLRCGKAAYASTRELRSAIFSAGR